MQTSTQSRILVVSSLLFFAGRTAAFSSNDLRDVKARINQLFTDFWEWKLSNNPQFATKIGISKYDDRLTELNLNAYTRRVTAVRSFLGNLRNITNGVNVSGDHDLDLSIELLKYDLEHYLSGMRFKTYLFPINNMEGPHNDYLKLLRMMRKDTVADYIKIITRMRLFSQQMDEMIFLLKVGTQEDLTINRRSFEKLIDRYGQIATVNIADNPFFASFNEKPKNITADNWQLLVNNARTTIRLYIQSSFKKFQSFLRDHYLVKSRPYIGVSSLPHGQEYYRGCLKYHTTTDLSAHEIHDIGLKEVARITKRMEEVKLKVRFEGTLSEFRRHLRTDRRFGFKNEQEILATYRNYEAKVKLLLPKYIGRIPTLRFIIAPVPKDAAPTAPFAWYDEPSADGRIPGIFYVNTYKPQTRRKYLALSLFLHEAIPGHHIQIASKIEFGSPVLFRRYLGMDVSYYEAPACFSRNSAYTEGWGLYAEYLGQEMGLYSDPYDLFGYLSQEMLRAARLVVDTGIHAFGWTRSKAIQYMNKNTAGSMTMVESEVDRYISWPGQACSYKIGELKIRELRNLAENVLGEKFDLRNFHDFIISTGNIPLTMLEKEVKLYLKKQTSS